MPERECLNCGETRASIKRQGLTLCGIEGGYEYRELIEEFPNHRWADWRDAELARMGVRSEAFEKHRRTNVMTFEWIACDDTVRGHRPAKEDDLHFMGVRKGQCILCGHDPNRPNGSRDVDG